MNFKHMNVKIILAPLLLSAMMDWTMTYARTVGVSPAIYGALYQARLREEEAYKKQLEEEKKIRNRIRKANEKKHAHNSTSH